MWSAWLPMKISTESSLESPTQETLTIKIVWNPRIDDEDGYAAMINSVIDTVKRNCLLVEALETAEAENEYLLQEEARRKSNAQGS